MKKRSAATKVASWTGAMAIALVSLAVSVTASRHHQTHAHTIPGIDLASFHRTAQPPQFFTMSGDAVDDLYPGSSTQVPVTVTNPLHEDIRVTSLTATVTGSDQTGCDATNLQLTSFSGLPFHLGAGDSTEIDLTASMPGTAPNECQGATFDLSYGGSATIDYLPVRSAPSGPIGLRSSNQGTLVLRRGYAISVGYHVFVGKSLRPSTLEVSGAQVTIPVKCPNGSNRKIVIPIRTKDYTLPGGSSYYVPRGSSAAAATFQAERSAPNLCNGRAMKATRGATFSAGMASTDFPVQVQFHYRVPAAKGFANVNCSSIRQNRNPGTRACTASWSRTGVVS